MNTPANFSSTVRTGGDAPSHSLIVDTGSAGTPPDLRSDTLTLAQITANKSNFPAGICPFTEGFQLTVDGALKVTTLGGEVIVFPTGTFPLQQQISLRIAQIWATGTTATGIFIFWEN